MLTARADYLGEAGDLPNAARKLVLALRLDPDNERAKALRIRLSRTK